MSAPRHLIAAVVALAVASCTPGGTPSPTSRSAQATAGAARPIVIDTDLAGDDILAIMSLLRDPAVDVRAVTVAGTGEVHCAPGLRNARRLVAAFGRTDVPVACGPESPGPNGRSFPSPWRDGADGFYGLDLPAVADETSSSPSAPALLLQLAADGPEPLAVVALGPWTNLAAAAVLDPQFVDRLAGIHAMGGAIDVEGNVDVDPTHPANGVEWNFGADPDALAAVMATDVAVTLVPLDATNDVPVPADIQATLESDHAAAGADIAFEMYVRNGWMATSGSSYWDPLAAITLDHPAVASWADILVSVRLSGAEAGRIVRADDARPIHVALSADPGAFMTLFLAALRSGAPRQ